MTFAEEVGWTIEQARVDQGWTLGQLAQEADVSRSYLSEVERGLKCISFEKMARIARVLDISLDGLVAPWYTASRYDPMDAWAVRR